MLKNIIVVLNSLSFLKIKNIDVTSTSSDRKDNNLV